DYYCQSFDSTLSAVLF
nr:immunoglobulin light chain junction region [Macaca mulatta]MOX28289.1 immunoglobulin light chain junction region [Macaca mulatta]MOX28852.1 immunoglobulin light chain junction region [Macaca mulatta]MOX29682.1 immunoglobulin light chain junction region [Macaca mulatta]MOX30105.1 immunoglobulin light chain junction region [Macaca mulatta]